MHTPLDPRRLDVVRFAQEAGALAAKSSVGQFSRLSDETSVSAGERPVEWSARGEMRNPGHLRPQVWVHLEARTTLPLACQRCLEPVEVPVEARRSFRFVADEATAAAEDDESDEDLLVQSRSFDLLELIEDELLMSLPLAPKHDVCPSDVKLAAGQEEFDAALARRENPFAGLSRLKSGKS